MEARRYEDRTAPPLELDGESINTKPIIADPIVLLQKPYLSKLGRGDLVFPLEPITFEKLQGSDALQVISIGGDDAIESRIFLGSDGIKLTDLMSAKSTHLDLELKRAGTSVSFIHAGREIPAEEGCELLCQDHKLRKLPAELQNANISSTLSAPKRDETYEGIVVNRKSSSVLQKLSDSLLEKLGLKLGDSAQESLVRLNKLYTPAELEQEIAAESGSARALKYASFSVEISPIKDGWYRIDFAEALRSSGLNSQQIRKLASSAAFEHAWDHPKVQISIAGNDASLSCGIAPEGYFDHNRIEHFRIRNSEVLIHVHGDAKPLLRLHFTLSPAGDQEYAIDFDEVASLIAVRDTLAKSLQPKI